MFLRYVLCSLPAVSFRCMFCPFSLIGNLTLTFLSATYTSTLAYIVDANAGRSSSAVATNSAFRGISAFVATEIAVPLQVSEPSVLDIFIVYRFSLSPTL